MSLVLWLITRSVFALVFAALGPAVAIGSLVDARRSARRRRRLERARFAAECAVAAGEIDAGNAVVRSGLDARTPSVVQLLAESRYDPRRWEPGSRHPSCVRVGTGTVPGPLELDGARDTATRLSRDPAFADLARLSSELTARARSIPAAPVTADLLDGIAVVGPARLAHPVARGLLVQVANALSPADWGIEVRGEEQGWLRLLPHRVSGAGEPAPADTVSAVTLSTTALSTTALSTTAPSTTVRFVRLDAAREAGGFGADPFSGPVPKAIVVVIAPTLHAVLSAVRTVVVVTGATTAQLSGGSAPTTVPVTTVPITSVQAARFASWLTAIAAEDGLLGAERALPDCITLEQLRAAEPDRPAGPGSLGCVFVVAGDGPLRLDLVTDGPHAVIGGTTGSGKSELLIAWVAAMASTYSPEQFVVLLVDFKGGASFADLAGLPHCVGMISDLDELDAVRALASLAAEVKYRERILAEAGARSIDDLWRKEWTGTRLPRLVIVVDEFAAMVTGYPGLHTLFADIAARGRSLGMHLVLCTQRPSGAVRDSVLANTGLRMSLRVNNRADSSAVIGSDAAASLAPNPRGRALVSVAGETPVAVQVALAAESDVKRAAEKWPETPVRRPWLPPLPRRIAAADLHSGPKSGPASASAHGPAQPGLVFALADRPDSQSQPPVAWDPDSQGNLMICGAAGSGKTTAIAMLAAAAAAAAASGATESHSTPIVRRISRSPELAWDELCEVRDRLRAGERRRLVLVDDLDAIVARLPDEYRSELVDVVLAIAREARTASSALVITVQRPSPVLGPVLALCDSRLLLRQSTKADHLIAGGVGDQFDAELPPGGGCWRGDRVQVAVPAGDVRPREDSAAAAPAVAVHPGDSALLVVSRRPAALAARLRTEHPETTVIELSAAGADPRELVIGIGVSSTTIVGDPTEWQSRWGALDSLAATAPVFFDGCTASDFRSITRERALPPPILDGATGWLWSPSTGVRRARIEADAPRGVVRAAEIG